MVVLSSPLLDETAVRGSAQCSGGPVGPRRPVGEIESIFHFGPAHMARHQRHRKESDRENEKQAWSLFTHGSRQQQAGLLRIGRKESTLKQQ